MSEYDLDDKRRWLLGRIDHGADNSDTVTAALYRVGVHIAEAIRQSKGEDLREALRQAEVDRDTWIETAKSLGGELTLLKIGAQPQPAEGEGDWVAQKLADPEFANQVEAARLAESEPDHRSAEARARYPATEEELARVNRGLMPNAQPQPAEGVERPGRLVVEDVVFFMSGGELAVDHVDGSEYLRFTMESAAHIHHKIGQILAYAKRRAEEISDEG